MQLTVWHDGACPLCQREIALMRRLDRAGRIEFIDATTADDASCPIDRGLLLERFHAREGDQMLSGMEAFTAMWRQIPLLRPLGLLGRVPGVLPIMEALYRRFLRVRPRIAAWVRARGW